jgi:uncharacterized protein
MSVKSLRQRIDGLAWSQIGADLDARGFSAVGKVLTAVECDRLAKLYANDSAFRSHIIMARHGFGRGEYKYFNYPLPESVGEIREAVYPHIAPIANRWAELMNVPQRFPDDLAGMLKRCHDAGQIRPTPLLLKYEAEDYNCLHQDLYGDHVFPMQLVLCLSEPGIDFEGGEFVVVEQRPRMQSKAEIVPLRKGEGAIFAVSHRPHKGSKGYYRVNLKHGVSRVRSGHRQTCGIIFHDAA